MAKVIQRVIFRAGTETKKEFSTIISGCVQHGRTSCHTLCPSFSSAAMKFSLCVVYTLPAGPRSHFISFFLASPYVVIHNSASLQKYLGQEGLRKNELLELPAYQLMIFCQQITEWHDSAWEFHHMTNQTLPGQTIPPSSHSVCVQTWMQACTWTWSIISSLETPKNQLSVQPTHAKRE